MARVVLFDGRQRRRREGASAHGAAVGQRPHRSRAALFALLRERPVGASRPNSRSSIRCWWPTPISRRTRCSPRCTASSGSWGATVPPRRSNGPPRAALRLAADRHRHPALRRRGDLHARTDDPASGYRRARVRPHAAVRSTAPAASSRAGAYDGRTAR